jgi:hypothetical protein
MTQRITYEITVKVQREGLLTLPIAGFRVRGTLDPARNFAKQLGETITEQLARVLSKLEKARRR